MQVEKSGTAGSLGVSVRHGDRGRFLVRLTATVTLVTGTMFLMWLGEQITEGGLGNGISIIILAVSQLVCQMQLETCWNWFVPVR